MKSPVGLVAIVKVLSLMRQRLSGVIWKLGVSVSGRPKLALTRWAASKTVSAMMGGHGIAIHSSRGRGRCIVERRPLRDVVVTTSVWAGNDIRGEIGRA